MAHVQLISLVVHEYDPAIAFFVDVLGFELVEDRPEISSMDGSPKRWVVVRPPGGPTTTGVLIARAANAEQTAAVGNQHGGRVGFFLEVEDFESRYQHMVAAGVEFLGEPREEPYGWVVVFRDIAGNKWDLLGPSGTS